MIEVSALDESIAISIDGITHYGLGEAVLVEPNESVIEYVEIPACSNGATTTAFVRLEEGKMIMNVQRKNKKYCVSCYPGAD